MASKIILFVLAVLLLLGAVEIAGGVTKIVTLQPREPAALVLMVVAVIAIRMLRKRLE
jgi:choline-glycine betaine transporter